MQREIRQFRPEDAENVARMWNESDSAWPGGFTRGVPFTAERVLRDQTRTRFLATFIAFADGKAVGYCSMTRFWQDPRVAYVAVLGAHPAYHGQGFGRDLLKAALAKAVELGYDRLDLHTWAGNLKAVPLYKKMGFFWVPDTSVHMESYLPTIFRLDCARRFFEGADWYVCFRRDLSIRPDVWLDEGMKVFPYEFERDGRRLRVLIDPEAHAVAAVETDRFAVACRFAGERAPAGVPAKLRWDVRNKQPEAGPMRVTLIAHADEGLQVDFRRSLDLAGAEAFEATVLPDREARERHSDDPAHQVRTTAIVGDEVLELGTGLRICQPVDVLAPGHCVHLTPGVPKTVSLLVRSNLESATRVAIRLAGPPELRLDPSTLEVEVPAGGSAGVATRATASAEGAFGVACHLALDGAESGARPKPQAIPVHAVGLGGVVGSFDEARVYLSSAQLRVVANRRAAGISVFDASSGARLGDSHSTLGPPFGASELDSRDFDVALERTGNSLTAVLTCHSSTYPGLAYQRRIELAPGPAVRIGHRVVNGSEEPRTLQVLLRGGGGPDPARLAVPLRDGLVVEPTVAFPDWRDPALTTPGNYQESWVAAEGDGVVAGFVWERAATVELGGWSRVSLTLDFGEVGPSQAVDTPAAWLVAGSGGWQAVREFWRARLAPDAPEQAPAPRRALEVRLEPPVVVGDAVTVAMRSLRSRPLTGRASLEFPDGPRVEPTELDVAGWARGAPVSQRVGLRWPSDRPGAWGGTFRAGLDAWCAEFPLVVVRGGDGRTPVRIREERREGRPVVVVDNGWLSFAVAPDFGGALVELTYGRTSHLATSFPKERPYLEFNPWFGGVTPQAYPSRLWGGAQPMAAGQYRWEEAEREGLLGQHWRGIALSAEPAHRDLKGFGYRVEYLTLGRSNLVAVTTRLEPFGAPVSVDQGVLAFVAPGGSAEGVVSHFEREGLWSHPRAGEVYLTTDGWAAAENPATGDVVALVAGAPSTRIILMDVGSDGLALAAGNRPTQTDLGRAEETVAYLVLTRSLAEARLYRALAASAR